MTTVNPSQTPGTPQGLCCQINARVTQKTKALLATAAREAGLNEAEWIRALVERELRFGNGVRPIEEQLLREATAVRILLNNVLFDSVGADRARKVADGVRERADEQTAAFIRLLRLRSGETPP
jgi:hypothetical protein